MTRANRLIGLPVILDGAKIGVVDQLDFSPDARQISALTVQTNGLKSGSIPACNVQLVGENAVLVTAAPVQRRSGRFVPGRVRDTSGLMLGIVTDVMVDETTLSVTALELSFGPIDDILTGRRWVKEFSRDPKSGETIVPCEAWLINEGGGLNESGN